MSYCNPGPLLFSVALTALSAVAAAHDSDAVVLMLFVALLEARHVFEP